jgi:hypothetical protein
MISLLRMVEAPLLRVAGHQSHSDSAHKRLAQRRRKVVPPRTSYLNVCELNSRAYSRVCVETEALLSVRSDVVVSAEGEAEAGRAAHLTTTVMTATRLELRVGRQLPYVRI